jgi:hypothetical protein
MLQIDESGATFCTPVASIGYGPAEVTLDGLRNGLGKGAIVIRKSLLPHL